jgi:serine/threonine protein kinase
MKKDNISFAVSTYQKKEWFFSRLAGINIIPTASDNYPRDFVETLSTKLDEILEKNKDEISSYQEVIRSYIFSKHFSRIKKSAEGIVSSLLKVIRILRNNKIAIRDLKPDNLYVIADANKSIDFLAKSGEYAIGLIDFETAVILEKNSKGEIDQPLLAGTLYYATPSHLFPNEFLSRIFPDLPRILYLQDWFAMVGIIYNVATGERLFNRTGQLLSKLGKKMQESINENRPPEIVFRKGSQAFWQKALSEYNHNTKEHENILDFINVTIGEEENIVFRNEARISIEKLKRTIKILIHSQKIFRSEKSREKLINASYNSISKTRSKWEKEEVAEEATPEIRERVILFLKDLEELKLKLDNRMHILEMLNANNLKICLSFLLDFMFETVLMSMYNREWDRLKPDEYRPPDKENVENTITDRQSRSFEQSIDD